MGISDVCSLNFYAFLVEKSLKGELGYDILCSEECVDLCKGRVVWIRYRVLVDNADVLKDKRCEWLKVDLFDRYLTIKLFREGLYDFFGNCGLYLRELNC